jgi:hypothetical protein
MTTHGFYWCIFWVHVHEVARRERLNPEALENSIWRLLRLNELA